MRQSRVQPSIYQLRIVLRGISPLIWHRLLVRSDTTLAQLHAILQYVADWQCNIRLEAILPCDPKRFYPVCTGGKRACTTRGLPGHMGLPGAA